jgi:ATP-binding cassette subfamily A (ABC1) protein 3
MIEENYGSSLIQTHKNLINFSFSLPGHAKMTSRWDKFKLLMWKNWLLQWRHKIQSLIEILIPVLFSALLVLIRSLVTPDIFPERFIYSPLGLKSFLDMLKLPEVRDAIRIMKYVKTRANLTPSNTIFYSPENPALNSMMSLVSNVTRFGLSGFNDSASLEVAMVKQNPFLGVQFPDEYAVST